MYLSSSALRLQEEHERPDHMSGMESSRPPPEQWTQYENVLEVLGYMLAVPLGDHRVAVSNALVTANPSPTPTRLPSSALPT